MSTDKTFYSKVKRYFVDTDAARVHCRVTVKSLAEALGVPEPTDKERTQPPAVPFRTSAKQFARDIVNSSTYRESIARRVLMDELPAPVEVLLLHYAYGKPVERLEVETKNDLSGLTLSQLEERAMMLTNLARKMQAGEPLTDDTDKTAPGVH